MILTRFNNNFLKFFKFIYGLGSSQTMPFTLQQLVAITGQLKDISLGLVDLAFPDSRPAVKEHIRGIEYSISFHQPHLWSNLFKVIGNFSFRFKSDLQT